jgi:hypothetical protein
MDLGLVSRAAAAAMRGRDRSLIAGLLRTAGGAGAATRSRLIDSRSTDRVDPASIFTECRHVRARCAARSRAMARAGCGNLHRTISGVSA